MPQYFRTTGVEQIPGLKRLDTDHLFVASSRTLKVETRYLEIHGVLSRLICSL